MTYKIGDVFDDKDAPKPDETQCPRMWDGDGSIGWSCAFSDNVNHSQHVAIGFDPQGGRIGRVLSTSMNTATYIPDGERS